MVGLFGEMGVLGDQVKQIVMWSPYGTVKRVVAAGMNPSTWNNEITMALLVTLAYAALFAFVGIRKFKWSNK